MFDLWMLEVVVAEAADTEAVVSKAVVAEAADAKVADAEAVVVVGAVDAEAADAEVADAEAVVAFRCCSHCRVTKCWKEPKEVRISWEEWVISWMMMSISSGRISSWMDLV